MTTMGLDDEDKEFFQGEFAAIQRQISRVSCGPKPAMHYPFGVPRGGDLLGPYPTTKTRRWIAPLSTHTFSPSVVDGARCRGDLYLDFTFSVGKIVGIEWANPANWLVHDFVIGQRSQFINVGSITAKMLLAMFDRLDVDVVHVSQRVNLSVENLSSKERTPRVALLIAAEST